MHNIINIQGIVTISCRTWHPFASQDSLVLSNKSVVLHHHRRLRALKRKRERDSREFKIKT